jgi:hypothetical protein
MASKIPFVHKIDKRAVKITTSYVARPSKIFPNWDFWFENTPSGNTVLKLINAKMLMSFFPPRQWNGLRRNLGWTAERDRRPASEKSEKRGNAQNQKYDHFF